ncbi:MAG: hypothetical protein R3E98_17790 [Gemmatimonadota bacterium]
MLPRPLLFRLLPALCVVLGACQTVRTPRSAEVAQGWGGYVSASLASAADTTLDGRLCLDTCGPAGGEAGVTWSPDGRIHTALVVSPGDLLVEAGYQLHDGMRTDATAAVLLGVGDTRGAVGRFDWAPVPDLRLVWASSVEDRPGEELLLHTHGLASEIRLAPFRLWPALALAFAHDRRIPQRETRRFLVVSVGVALGGT